MLLHSGPLRLVHCLLYVEPLPFGCISSEDHELVQFTTVLESSPHAWMPFFGNFTTYSKPMSCTCASCDKCNPIGSARDRKGSSSEACTSWHLGMLFLGFLEHLLGLLNLQLVSLHVVHGRLRPSSLDKILQRSSQLIYNLGQLPALHVESLWLMRWTYTSKSIMQATRWASSQQQQMQEINTSWR